MKFVKGCGLVFLIALAISIGYGFLSGIFSEPPTPEELARQDSLQAVQNSIDAVERARRDSLAAVAAEERRRKAASKWQRTYFTNEWGERSGEGTKSEEVRPVERMEFPYHGVKATLFASCQNAWIRFSDSPNLTGGDIRDGYEEYRLRVRIDGRDLTWRATQDWGSKDLDLPSSVRNAWANGTTFEVVTPWFEQGAVRFSWSLVGYSDAYAEACG